MTAITLNGVASSRGRVQIPAWGCWWADVELTDDAELSGAITLVVLDQTLVGTIVSGGIRDGRAAYRVVGGHGGWGSTVPARDYADDFGVLVSQVAVDVAAAAGETVADAPTTRLGPHWTRAAGPASATLHAVAPQAWHVGLDGVTRLAVRAGVVYTGQAPRVRVDLAGGLVELAVDEGLASLVPGVVVDGLAPATDVEWSWDDTRLTARVFAGPRPSRRLDAWRRIVDAVDPARLYRGVYECRVVTQEGDRLNLQPVRASHGLPDLARVSYRSLGARSTFALGSTVLVAFVDASPARPVVVAGEVAGADGWSPTLLELGDAAGDYVALAAKTDANFAALYTLFNSWVPVPTDGGSALKALWTAWVAGPPPHIQFDAVGASKVKAL